MILVEGVDNSGKTTLVAQIAKTFPQLKVRPSIGNKHDLAQIRQQARDEAMHGMPRTLADRSRIISEYVYNPVLKVRKLAYPSWDWMEWLRRYGLNHQQLVICCDIPTPQIMATMDEREQLPGVADNIEALKNNYMRIGGMVRFLFDMSSHNSAWIQPYNYTFMKPEDAVFPYVEQYLEDVKDKRDGQYPREVVR